MGAGVQIDPRYRGVASNAPASPGDANKLASNAPATPGDAFKQATSLGSNQSGAGRNQINAPANNSWEAQFLTDIGAPNTQTNDVFLNAWSQAEGPSSLGYNNPFNTTQQAPGSYSVNSVGVQGYGSMAQGLQENAAVLEQNHPGYAQLLQGLRSGNVSPMQLAQLEANTPWGTGSLIEKVIAGSGSGYAGLMGNAAANLQQNGPGIASDAVGAQNTVAQEALNQAMAGINAQYATQESQFQQQGLGISQAQLGVQQGQLNRLTQEYPQLHQLQQQQNALSLAGMRANEQQTQFQYQTQAGDTQRQYTQQFKDMTSSAAGSGTTFTAGNRDQTALQHQTEASTLGAMKSQYAASVGAEKRGEEGLATSEKTQNVQYLEQMQGLKDQQKNLNLLALRYGVSANEIKSRLSNTLQQMGLSAQMTESDLAQQLAQTDINMGALINGSITPPMQGVSGLGGGLAAQTPQTPTYPSTPSGG